MTDLTTIKITTYINKSRQNNNSPQQIKNKNKQEAETARTT